MKARLIWGNLVSGNIQRTADFYSALGFKKNGKGEAGQSVSFFFANNDFIINFFTEERLSKPMNGGLSLPMMSNEVIFSISADSKEEVDQWVQKVIDAKGTICTPPQGFEQGYTFCFADPDNHKFNVLYWPGM